jgi:glycosyltransferase involved in cell wall biosynthesis
VRIAYVTETYPPELNGVAATVARTTRLLADRGWAVDLVRPRQPHEDALDSPAELRTRGMVLPMYPDLRLGLATSGRLVERWQRERPSVVHVATEGPLGLAAVNAARRLALPLTSDFRTNFHAYSRHYGLPWAESMVFAYLRRFHNRTDRTFVPTAQMKAQLEAAGFAQIEVIGRGVDAALFTPARRDPQLRAAWGVRDNEPVVLYVGRLAPEKNVRMVFESFRVLAHRANQRRCGARLVVVGDGPLRDTLRDEYPEAIFTGPRRGEDLARHYASADLFLFPSLTDTFGNVVTEALSSGLLVIAYDLAAAGTHVKNGVNGLLVRPGDSHGFVATASAAGAQFTALAPLRTAARQTAESLGWESIVRRFETSLLQLTQNRAEMDVRAAVA